MGLAVVAAIGAVVYRLIEAPRERSRSGVILMRGWNHLWFISTVRVDGMPSNNRWRGP
jgi:hypothetical protein